MENEERTCTGCGCIIEGDAVMIDGEAYCAECAEDFVQCANCGEWIKRDESITGPDGEDYCESCSDNLFFYCEECGCTEWADDCVIIADNPYQRRCGNVSYVCRDCAGRVAYQCEDCGEWYTDGIQDTRDGYRCEDCLEDYCYCEECGEYVHYDEWDSEAEMCCRCAEENGCHLIGQYHDRPRLEYIGKCLASWRGVWRGIGIELEIDRDESDREAEKDTAERLKEIAGDSIYFNRDGSLSHGFEIITQPHTVAAFYSMKWEEMLNTCKDNGYTSHDAGTCGLHLHISREMFGSTEERQGVAISKLIRFYDCFYNDILKVSRRTPEQAERWANRYGTHNRREAEEYGKKKKDAGRYYAVNNTNHATVEIRITRGTLNYNTFMACIDFMLTIAKNSRRISWKNVERAAEWLKGLKPDTINYIKKVNAFEGVL